MKYLLLFLFLIPIVSCKHGPHDYGLANNIDYLSTTTDSIPKRTLAEIIALLRKATTVEYEHIGYARMESKTYKNYVELYWSADTPLLVKLTTDTSAVLACYASWALVHKNYTDLPSILNYFLKHDRRVSTWSGCIMDSEPISSEFYHQYWNSLDSVSRIGDKALLAMDSMILYYEHSYWLLTDRALENRKYNAAYDRQIEYLAFVKINKDAIDYIGRTDRPEYMAKLQQARVQYFQKTEFSKIGITPYYELVEELLKTNDDKLKILVIAKLKSDRHWRCEENSFITLLGKYGISKHEVD